MNLFKNKCWFFHQWGQWSNPVKTTSETEEGIKHTVWIQTRVCQKCSNVQMDDFK
jgi:hypothetical protein